MSTKETNPMQELEDMKNDYQNRKTVLSEQTIADDAQIKAIIAAGINDLKIAERKVSLIAVSGILMLSLVLFYNSLDLLNPVLKYSTIALVAIYISFILANRSGKLEKLYEKDVNSFVSGVKKQRKNQFWIIRVYLIAFCVWATYMILVPLIKLDSLSEKLTLVAMLLPVVMVNVVVTFRLHNEIIGSYEGLVLAAENPEAAKMLDDCEKGSNTRRHNAAKRKYVICLVMIALETIGFVWEGIRVIQGKGIIATLAIFAIFLVLFIILAGTNRKEMGEY